MQNKQNGQIIVIAIVFTGIVVTLVTSLVGYATIQIRSHRTAIAEAKALSIAEAGLEKAVWKLNNQTGYGGETNTLFGEGVYNITITNLSSSSKLIKAEAFVPGTSGYRGKKTIQVTAVIGTTNVGFSYGVQVGNGGIEMNNSSSVVGNVYSNGNIVGTNSARIEGTAIAAGPSSIIDGMDIDFNSWSHTIRGGSNVLGNATHSVLQNTNVTGNVIADSISTCIIGGNATYDTRTSCTVSGTATTPNTDIFEPAPLIDLPISDEQIDTWEMEAEAGGVIGTQSYNTGTHNLGPVKINGDLILTNDAILNVTGTIWVTGQIRILNNTIMRLNASYGELSGVVMAGIDGNTTAGFIETDNSSQVLGSGTVGSYLMLLSQRSGTSGHAIKTNQFANTAIFYAGDGMIEVLNNASLKEITAYKLIISNSARVTYETGLANAEFVTGPGGGWEISNRTWQLLD